MDRNVKLVVDTSTVPGEQIFHCYFPHNTLNTRLFPSKVSHGTYMQQIIFFALVHIPWFNLY